LVDPWGLYSFAFQFSSGGIDITLPIYDSNKGFGGYPTFGVSTTLLGGGLVWSFDNPCNKPATSSEDDTYLNISTGLSKYGSVGFNQDMSRFQVNFGTGIGLPGLNYSTSMQNFTQGLSN